MLGRETKNDPLPPPPDHAEINAFVLAKRGGPTAENFRLQFGKTHLTEWNKKAVKVFAKTFVESGDYTSCDKRKIEEAFKVHLKTLFSHYDLQVRNANSLPSTQRIVDSRQAAARRSRRNTVRNPLTSHIIYPTSSCSSFSRTASPRAIVMMILSVTEISFAIWAMTA